jgi:hypothetical protein
MNDYTGIISGNPKVSGFHASLFCFRGGAESGIALGGNVAAEATPPYNYNRDENNIIFEPTYYGPDSRNGGSNPPNSIIGIDENSPWGSGEDAASRALRGPQFRAIFHTPVPSKVTFLQYQTFGISEASSPQGFKGKIGSPAPYGAYIPAGTTINFTYQYHDTPFIEAGVGDSNLSAATPLGPTATSVTPASTGYHSGLNLTFTNLTGGIYYNFGIGVFGRYSRIRF